MCACICVPIAALPRRILCLLLILCGCGGLTRGTFGGGGASRRNYCRPTPPNRRRQTNLGRRRSRALRGFFVCAGDGRLSISLIIWLLGFEIASLSHCADVCTHCCSLALVDEDNEVGVVGWLASPQTCTDK